MSLILYYFEASPPVRSVDLVIHALGINDEHKCMDIPKKEQMTPEFLKINPLHTVPAIDDDGYTLGGSQAIATYLADKYGQDDSLYPKDLQKRGIVDQMLFYSEDVFCLSKDILAPLLHDGIQPTPEMLGKVKEVQGNVERLLTGRDFIAGDNLTLADFSFITTVDVFELFCPTGNKYPLTKEWIRRCKTTMKDFEKTNKKGADLILGLIKNALTN